MKSRGSYVLRFREFCGEMYSSEKNGGTYQKNKVKVEPLRPMRRKKLTQQKVPGKGLRKTP